MDFTSEQLAKAKAAKSVEELLAYAKEINFALTEDEAKFYFDQWHKEGELSDSELDNVSGGSQCVDGKSYSSDPPYYLIITAGNSCPGYEHDLDYSIDNGTCFCCGWRYCTDGFVSYCHKRKLGNDLYG